jgi:predicted Fe-S protein YdhL (DUF1289 family)
MRAAATYILSLALARVPVPSPNMPQPIQSPCTRICTIDEATRLCSGCGRTIDEIARWSQMSDNERQRILASLPGRHGQDRRAGGR